MASLAVHHLAVVVADLAASERFYAGVLELPVQRRWEDAEGRPRSVWLALGDSAFLAIERAEAPLGRTREDTAPGLHCLALGIRPEERAAWRARLVAHGLTIERESPYTLYTRDPDGNLVGLSHFPHPAVEG
jgi:hypothetical protein